MWEGTEKPQQQAPPQQHCCKSSNSDTGRDPPCLLAQDVGHLCLSLGSGDIQAQFGDSSPTLHTNARLSLVLVSSASLEGRKCMADSTWGGAAHIVQTSIGIGYNRNKKESFFSSKQSRLFLITTFLLLLKFLSRLAKIQAGSPDGKS